MIRKKVQVIVDTLPMSLSRIAMGDLYKDHWSIEFSWKETQRILCFLIDELRSIDWTDLNYNELKALGFRKFEEETELMLIPAYVFKALPDGLTLYCIDGRSVIIGKDVIDTDTRFGCLAFGIYPKDKTKVGG